MDEPGWAWPAWKFGMKRDDLFGRLHAQYNTFASTIQDPEAFHHDVYEISMAADTSDVFHRLMAQRQAQRLRELNDSLESAAIEIIANPKLIGSDQWQYALQLFRTKSFDSLVRYFASYLPQHILHPHDDDDGVSSRGSSFAETCSVTTASSKPSTVDDLEGPLFFTDAEDKPLMTHEPLSIASTNLSISVKSQMPLSPPRSMTVDSDASVESCGDDVVVVTHEYTIAPTPSRSMSFSGSESERFAPCERGCRRDESEDEALATSQSDFGTPMTSGSEMMAASHSSLESISEIATSDFATGKREVITIPDDDDDLPSAQPPYDVFDDDDQEVVETPTPRQETVTTNASSYIDSKMLRSSGNRTLSPRSARLLRRSRDGSPAGSRRSPEESMSRIQKSIDPLRSRPRGRRRAD